MDKQTYRQIAETQKDIQTNTQTVRHMRRRQRQRKRVKQRDRETGGQKDRLMEESTVGHTDTQTHRHTDT
jgi:hypothetical protein